MCLSATYTLIKNYKSNYWGKTTYYWWRMPINLGEELQQPPIQRVNDVRIQDFAINKVLYSQKKS